MPRKAKQRTPAMAAPYNTGSPTPDAVQAVKTPTGLPYGENQQLARAQQSTPLPATPAPPPPAPDPQAAYDAAQQYQMPDMGMFAQSQRPDQPVTAGLPIGAGPGPEILRSSSPGVADTLETIASATGDPFFAELAMRQRMGMAGQ